MGHYIDEQGNSVPVSTSPKVIAAGKVLEVKQPTPKTGQLDVVHPTQTTAAPAAVGNAVHAAGGTSAGAEPTSMEASPPSTAVAGNAAGASSAVAESVPAAPVVEDAKLPASNVAAVNATAAAGEANIPEMPARPPPRVPAVPAVPQPPPPRPLAGVSTPPPPSAALQTFVDNKAHAWTLYKDRLPLGGYRYWHFNLCGKLRFNVDDEQHISTDAPDIVSRQSHWRSVLYCEDRHEV